MERSLGVFPYCLFELFIELSFMKKLLLAFSFLLFCKPCFANIAEGDDWLALVHYRPKTFGGYESTIDSENFFLSENGKTNPKAELEATINLFESDDEQRCFFPARYKLLKKHNLAKKDFPKCKDLEKFYDDLQPSGVTFLFTDAYMNNPSSLFGHTLLRIDTARKGTQLLAHGVNFGAYTEGQENTVLYAILGLTGGYYGGYTVKPYYDIINTYNNIENRDIWEFNIDFTPQELDYFVAHLWEVGQTQTRYYFFTENCSYILMEFFDAVRPSLKLADDFPAQTIPLDTVKAVYARPGLVKSVNYRPSRQAKIRHRYDKMSNKEKNAYIDVILKQNWGMEKLDDSQKADVLETAYQYIQYQYVAREVELKEYRSRSFEALKARSGIKESGRIDELTNGKTPLKTHDSMRATIGAGVRNGEGFQEISYRPAYHSLTDNNYGFLRGAEINFLNTTIRHYDQSNKTVLQQFDLVGIKSISPIDVMFSPISYVIEAGIAREMNPRTEKEGYVFNLKVGGGATYALTDEIWVYGLGNAYGAYGGFLPRSQWVGVGFAGGMFIDVEKIRILAEAEKVFATDKFADKMKYKVEASYALSRNLALAVEYNYHQNYGKDLDEAILSGRVYF